MGSRSRRAAAGLTLLLAAFCASREQRPPRLIVLIVVDALRADHLGCYGSQRGLSPAIDRLARRSLLFERATAASAWTRSAIATLFTSRHPSAHGVLGFDTRLGESQLTLAEVLAPRGWETIAVTTNGNAGRLFGFSQGFESFTYPGYFDGEFRAEGVTEVALQIVDQRLERLGDRPLFLYLHYVDPHDPYLQNAGLLAEPEPAGRFDGTRGQLDLLDALSPAERTAADQARIGHLYAGEVSYCDRWIGTLLEGLEARGLWDETMLVLTADHGEGLWDHGQRSHGYSLYEEQIHVPLLVHYPGTGRAAARRLTTPVSTIDVAPTILRAAGFDPPAEFQGHDLAPLLAGPRPSDSQGVFSQLRLAVAHMDAVSLGSLKLIRTWRGAKSSRADAVEIYDLAEDPHERVNLAGRADGKREQLEAALRRWRRRTRPAARVGDEHKVDPESLPAQVKEQLRALGYVR